MNNSFASIRRRAILDALEHSDVHSREDLLIDKIIKLEDTLHDLQEMYAEVCINYKNKCVQPPF